MYVHKIYSEGRQGVGQGAGSGVWVEIWASIFVLSGLHPVFQLIGKKIL